VLYQGRIVERGAPDTLFRRAAHPYTRALLQAVPRLDPGATRERRAPPPTPAAGPGAGTGTAPAEGCAFAPRCGLAHPRCHAERPTLRDLAAGAAGVQHTAACHLAEHVAALPGGEA
jgi:peptide/nickel transport system ATP-binding protein